MPTDKAPSERWAMIAIALASCAIYLNTLSPEPVWDDAELLRSQRLAHEPTRVVEIFQSPYWGPEDYLYRPLTVWSVALGHTPRLNHAINVLLHAGVGCALFAMLRALSLGVWPSVVAGLLFVLHPLRTEAVAQIVGRAELLAALFGLLFLWTHRMQRSRLLTSACFAAALCSKESAIAFLPLCLWTDLILRPAGRPLRPWRYGVYLLVAAGWALLRVRAVPEGALVIPFLDNPLAEGATLVERWLTAARVQFDYLLLQVAPTGLSADYSHAQIPVVESFADPHVLGFAVVALGAAAAAFHFRETPRIVLYGVVGYAILFATSANVLFPIGTIMAERLTYAPSLMLAAAAGQLAWLARSRMGPAVTVALAVVLLLLGGWTTSRNRMWSSPESFARALVRSAPDSAKAHYTLGVESYDRGSLEGARASFERAIEIYPRYAEAWSRLGRVDSELGEFAEAARSHGRATEIAPRFTEAWYGLGNALQRMDRLEEAERAYRKALSLDPDLVSAYANLGAVYARAGRYEEAERMWIEALERDPAHAASRENLERLRER